MSQTDESPKTKHQIEMAAKAYGCSQEAYARYCPFGRIRYDILADDCLKEMPDLIKVIRNTDRARAVIGRWMLGKLNAKVRQRDFRELCFVIQARLYGNPSPNDRRGPA